MRQRRADSVAMPNFSEHLAKLLATKEGQEKIAKAMVLFCDIIDEAIGEGNAWITIGTTRGAKKALITVHEQDTVSTAAGATLEELLDDLVSL